MEMRRKNKFIFKWLRACCIVLLILFVQAAQAQVDIKSCSIKNGKMFIAIGKNLPKDSLQSFIGQYELADLDLHTFLRTGSTDSLNKLGWKVEINNAEVFVISKPLFSIDNISPGDKITFTQNTDSQRRSGDQEKFGYNRFKNKAPFTISDSVVRFFLRGNTNAGVVNLAGSFNNWEPTALKMAKTDSGWIADVKLGPGKHLYKFIIDGDWRIDRDNMNTENDGMGNDNSVYYKPNYLFSLEGYTTAKKVVLAGSFNGWDERDLLMQKTASGWKLAVFLSTGTYTYRFIVDRNWLTDPGNPDKLPNEFNEFNSVIRIGTPYLFKLDGFLDAKQVVLQGDFNNWKDDELFMSKTATGWEFPYTLGAGNYEYKIKIDGKFTRDMNSGGNTVLVIDPNFTFRLKGFEHAKKIFVSGDFNNWAANSFAMKKEGDEWVFKAHLYKGKHRYKFIVDGEWILDPGNKLWEQNEHNTGNSVLWFERDQ
jgi:1,4-alpha-glucan branching enzyme